MFLQYIEESNKLTQDKMQRQDTDFDDKFEEVWQEVSILLHRIQSELWNSFENICIYIYGAIMT